MDYGCRNAAANAAAFQASVSYFGLSFTRAPAQAGLSNPRKSPRFGLAMAFTS